MLYIHEYDLIHSNIKSHFQWSLIQSVTEQGNLNYGDVWRECIILDY